MTLNFEIFIKLFGCAMVSVILSAVLYLLKRKTSFGKWSEFSKQTVIGLLFGAVAIFGTEYGVDIGGAVANARDSAPLCAGLLFGAPAGIIAGIIGGVWRWIAVAWGAGTYSRIACTVSTIFAGFYAGILRKIVFDNKRPSNPLAFVTGGVMEIIHLVVLFLTHLTDPGEAFEIVKICTIPMVLCNGISVLLATVSIKLTSTGMHNKDNRRKYLTQLFQTPLLIVIFLAYISSTLFVYQLQTYSAEQNAVNLIKLNIDDVKHEILDASNRQLINITRSIADESENLIKSNMTNEDLSKLADKYNVSVICYVNEDGIVQFSSNGDVGYDMGSDSTLPQGKKQSSEFLILLTDECDEYVQEYMPLHEDSSVFLKFAGVSLKKGGFIQVGYSAERFQNEVSNQVKDLTKNRHIGETGRIIIADNSQNIVSDTTDIDEESLPSNNLEIDKGTPLDEKIKVNVNGKKYLYMLSEAEGYNIIGVLPQSEVYETRDKTVYVNSYMEILIYAALFILIYVIIKKVVSDNLHNVNDSLGEIIAGNLDKTVDVKASEEFAMLSNDINSTVDTLKKYITDAEGRIDKELALAKNIQHSVLPSVFPPYPERKDFDIYAMMDTAKEVGGDFYDFYLLDEKRVAILIADVSGKGIPAAMFMMTAKTIIKSYAETGLAVNDVLACANEKLCEGNEADMFVTAWMGIFNTETGILEFANAGHNPPLVFRKDQKYEYLKSKPGLVLGGMTGVFYKKNEIQLYAGDKIFLYTDGVTEATNFNTELYGEQRLLNFLNSNKNLTCKETLEKVKSDIDSFVGDAEQFDDITMLMLSYSDILNQMEYKEYTACDNSLAPATEFLESVLDNAGASVKIITQVSVAFEEIFVNICHYAYPEKEGTVIVGVTLKNDEVLIEFKDRGIPFNPFSKDDPDITLSADEREIGGLGIFMTKKIMDEYKYEYKDGYNTVTLRKKL